MGEIVFWTLVRIAVILPLLWISKSYFDPIYWFTIGLLAIVFFIFYPTYLAYKNFIEKNKTIVSETLCSSCKHFDESAVLCIKYDKHPTENYVPCEGTDWEPR